MTTRKLLGLLLALVTPAACKTLEVQNFNGGSVGDLENSPTPTSVATAVQGLVYGTRDNGWRIKFAGMVGREGWDLDPTNQESVQGPMVLLEPGRYYVVFLYNPWYTNIRLANVALHATDAVAGMTAAEKEATKGFIKTIQAWDFLQLAEIFDVAGLPLDVDHAPGGTPAPIASKAEVYAHINQLLDEAKTHLQAGGATFPFTLTAGYAGFTAPADFLKFNRAVKAKANAYIADPNGPTGWDVVQTALTESFLDINAPMSVGVYDSYSTNSGDISTPQVYDPTDREVAAHASYETEAQLGVGGALDLRYTTKIAPIPSRTSYGITVDRGFRIYTTTSSPIPKIKNEELILLRAEANIAQGFNTLAIQDLNVTRVNSGGLPPLADPYVPTAAFPALLDQLLYEKRYSLLWEGAHRWADMRHYGRLAQLPKYLPNHVVYPYFPLPDAECVPRSPLPPGCAVPAGL